MNQAQIEAANTVIEKARKVIANTHDMHVTLHDEIKDDQNLELAIEAFDRLG